MARPAEQILESLERLLKRATDARQQHVGSTVEFVVARDGQAQIAQAEAVLVERAVADQVGPDMVGYTAE